MQQFTKKEIKLSMLRLLQSKPLDSIKVKNIIDDCSISRNTFYYHYDDIFDVLKEIFNEALEKVIETDASEFTWEDAFKKMAGSVLINKNIIYNIFSSKYFAEIEAYIVNAMGILIASKIREQCIAENHIISDENITIISTFYKHAVTGTFIEWIQKGMKTDPEEFIKKIGKIFPQNILNSIVLL
ncbi:TetR-like C-terminal domain-containing protein [uncultured Eubacterium sp.]|uniref:TetR/AcrR family transcriptional regulator n=1 Tax=uncultured Eubacterium sp. TaxID=165185 RepID=UPI00280445DF|nr:TetR-like C-terminal domain-containing protein [uncultured Eubacterium sp.]